MTPGYPESIQQLLEKLSNLPGLGPRSAERIVQHLLASPTEQVMELAEAIRKVKTLTRRCSLCYNLTEQDPCAICSDPQRDRAVVCVVEQARDVIALEGTGLCKWVYHVLGGHIAPLDGIEPDDLTIDALLKRVRSGGVREVVMATNPTAEGDATALYIANLLAETDVRITRLARGLPSGSSLEFANKSMLADAITGRQPVK